MPQGKGTYGSQKGRPPKKDKLTSGGMDAIYGVNKDVDKMSKTNAQDRIKKYALGQYVTQDYYENVMTGSSDRPNYQEEDLINQSQQGWNEGKRQYSDRVYGGGTSYDAKTMVAKDLPGRKTEKEPTPTIAAFEPVEEETGGIGPNFPNPFNSPEDEGEPGLGETSIGVGQTPPPPPIPEIDSTSIGTSQEQGGDPNPGGSTMQDSFNTGAQDQDVELANIGSGVDNYEHGGEVEMTKEKPGEESKLVANGEMSQDEVDKYIKPQITNFEEPTIPTSDARIRRG